MQIKRSPTLLLELLLLAREQRVHGRIELVAALEEIEFEDEDVALDGAAELLDEGAGCSCGAACDTSGLACCCMKCRTTFS